MTLPPCLLQPTAQDARRTSQGSVGQSQRAKATKLDDARRIYTPTSGVDKMAAVGVPSVLAVSSQPPPAGVGVGAVAGVGVGAVPPGVNTAVPPPANKSNPYVSSKMYASSFMSQEGSQNIQSLIGGTIPPTAAAYPPPPAQYGQAPPAMPMTSYPAAQQQPMAYQPPPAVYQAQAGYQQQAYQSYQATTQASYSQPMAGYDASVAATYSQSGYAGPYTAPAPGYPAQYQAAQPAAQPQYQTAPPPAQAPQYPSYPPPTQPPPAPGGYQGMGVPMQGYNPVAHTAAPPPPLTNPGQPPIRITGQHNNRVDRPATGHAMVRLTTRTTTTRTGKPPR